MFCWPPEVKKVLILSSDPYGETMYPHLFDVVEILKKYCEVYFYGDDDRGYALYRLGITKPPFSHPTFLISYIRTVISHFSNIRRNNKTISNLLKGNFDIVIAIDHSALYYACKYLNKNSRLVFWSMDYFAPDHQWMKSIWIQKLVNQNQKDIQKCDLIIVQNSDRSAVINSILMCHNIPKLFLPVSISSDETALNIAKRRTLNKITEKVTLMQLGSITSSRKSDFLIETYQNLPVNVTLILKGKISTNIAVQIKAVSKKPEVFSKSSSFYEMREIVNRADIGIIACDNKDLNNYFFSMASGQLVEFLRLGIPVIIIDMLELGNFVNTYECGLFINSFSELEIAYSKIIENYGAFSSKSFITYKKFFDLSIYRSSLICEILKNTSVNP